MKISKKVYINDNFITSIKVKSINKKKYIIEIILTTGNIVHTSLFKDKETARQKLTNIYNEMIQTIKDQHYTEKTLHGGGTVVGGVIGG